MTAPAPILSSSAAPRPTSCDVATANGSAPRDKTAGFAAHLAQETEAPQRVATAEPVQPAAPAASEPDPAEPSLAEVTPAPAEDPGKALPPTRQRAAALLAASAFLITAKDEPVARDEAAGDPAMPAAKTEAEGPAATAPVLTVIALPLPVAAPATQAPGAVKSATSAAPGSSTAITAPAAPGPGDVASAQSAPATSQPAAFTAANLVLERDAAAPATEAAQPSADAAPDASPTAAQIAARAQSAPQAAPQPAPQASTLAALAGAPERPGPRKPRSEAEAVLPAAEPASLLPDTAGALALSQPASAPAGSSFAAPATSGPQPLSFDQLVDSIARARDGVDQNGPVAVALRHGEFGRISLRIESDAAGLSVAMVSPDPGFAPAVAAAHAAAVPPEPLRMVATTPRAEASGQGLAQGQGQSGSGQQRSSGSAQRPAANPARAPAGAAERRSGIFA